MRCISAYEYVVSEVKVTEMLPVYRQVCRRNIVSIVAVNSDTVFSCRTSLLMLFVLLSVCRWTVMELLM